MCHLIHHPARLPDSIVEAYPAHLHINLLPRLQGRGIGRRLVDRWRAKAASLGATGAHLVVGTRNEPAVRFYRAYGFSRDRTSERPASRRSSSASEDGRRTGNKTQPTFVLIMRKEALWRSPIPPGFLPCLFVPFSDRLLDLNRFRCGPGLGPAVALAEFWLQMAVDIGSGFDLDVLMHDIAGHPRGPG